MILLEHVESSRVSNDTFHIDGLKVILTQVDDLLEIWKTCETAAAGLLTKLKGLSLICDQLDPIEDFKVHYLKAAHAAHHLGEVISGFAAYPTVECELTNALNNVAARDWKSLDSALANAPGLKDAISRICKEHQNCEDRITALWNNIANIARDLNCPFEAKISTTTLQQATSYERDLENLRREMGLKIEKAIAAGKEQGKSDLETMELQFDFGTLASSWSDELNELRGELTNGDSIARLNVTAARIADFRKKLIAAPDAQRLTSLTSAALSSDFKVSVILAVIQALNRHRRFGEALALFTSLQSACSPEEADLADFSPLVDALLESAAGACNVRNNNMWWPQVALEQPWLLSLSGSDIKDLAVQRKLAVCVMLLAQHREMEEWKQYFFNFNQGTLFEHSHTPIIHSFFGEMVKGPPSRIRESGHESRLSATMAEINTFFRHDSQRAEFSRQVAKKHDVHVVEHEVLFPKLLGIAQQIQRLCHLREFEEARRIVNNIDGEDLWADSCKSKGIAPWKGKSYTKGICGVHGYIPDLKNILKRHVAAASESTSESTISAEAIREEFKSLAGAAMCEFWSRAIADVTDAPSTHDETGPFNAVLAKLCAADPRVMASASHFVISLCKHPIQHQESQLTPEWNRILVRDMLRMLPERHPEGKHVEKLKSFGCIHHAAMVASLIPEMQMEADDLTRQSDQKFDDLLSALTERKGKPSKGALLEDVNTWLDWSCFPAVEMWIAEQLEQDRKLQAVTEDEKRRKLDALGAAIAVHRSTIMLPDNEPSFQEDVLKLINDIDVHTLRFRRLGTGQTEFDATLKRLEEWTDTIRFIIEHRDYQALTDLQVELSPGYSQQTHALCFRDAAPEEEAGARAALSTRDQDWINDALAEWKSLGDDIPLDELESAWLSYKNARLGSKVPQERQAEIAALQGAVKRFLKPFCGRCRLYAGENSEFGEGKILVHQQMPATLLTVGETAMHLPRNRYLLGKIALFVLPGKRPHSRHIDAVVSWIEEHPDYLNIVLVPGKEAQLARMKDDFESPKTVVIGQEEMEPLLSGPASVRLRQTYVREAGRAGIPFRADGVVHFENDLFAGREKELETLVTHSRFFLCGGRRMGKTSLMQALKHRLSSKGSEWNVAYLDGQIFRDVQSQSVGHWDLESWRHRSPDAPKPVNDPDLAIAREIATRLGLHAPEDLNDFRQKLLTLGAQTQIAILFDEIDCYIHASRWYHGDQRLPLLSYLRSIDFELNGKLKIIFAGFKDLYFESTREDVSDVGQPLGNWLEPMSVGTLSYHPEASNHIIREGLCNQMGFEIDAKACQKIWELASGHPAFIQYLCGKIAGAKLARSGIPHHIELTDVDAAYNDTKSGEGKLTYLEFVDRTLGLNLDALERSIILTIALSFRDEGERGTPIARDRIADALGDFCAMDSRSAPAPDHLRWAFKNLVMAGLLEQPKADFFQFKFRSYFDILTRLNQLVKDKDNRSNLDLAIREYDKMRHAVKQSLL